MRIMRALHALCIVLGNFSDLLFLSKYQTGKQRTYSWNKKAHTCEQKAEKSTAGLLGSANVGSFVSCLFGCYKARAALSELHVKNIMPSQIRRHQFYYVIAPPKQNSTDITKKTDKGPWKQTGGVDDRESNFYSEILMCSGKNSFGFFSFNPSILIPISQLVLPQWKNQEKQCQTRSFCPIIQCKGSLTFIVEK